MGIPAFGVPYANADQANHASQREYGNLALVQGIKTGVAMLMYLGQQA